MSVPVILIKFVNVEKQNIVATVQTFRGKVDMLYVYITAGRHNLWHSVNMLE